MILRPPISTLFPYTTLFRSVLRGPAGRLAERLLHLEQRTVDRGDAADRLPGPLGGFALVRQRDRKSTRLNSSHMSISYAVFCLKKKKNSSLSSCHDISSRSY